jgi:hypothetical protein
MFLSLVCISKIHKCLQTCVKSFPYNMLPQIICQLFH